jgi:hypothetical protein
MEIKILIHHLKSHGIEIVCESCLKIEENSSRKDNSRRAVPVSGVKIGRSDTGSVTRSHRLSKNDIPPGDGKGPTWIDSLRKQMSNKRVKSDQTVFGPEQNVAVSPIRTAVIAPKSPIEPRTPPNIFLNSNFSVQQKFPFINFYELIEASKQTPQKIDEIDFRRSHKNPNVLNFEFNPSVFSTAEPNRSFHEGDSLKDLLFDNAESIHYENNFAIRNIPSGLQSPFLLQAPRRKAQNGNTARINFDTPMKSLDFMDNQFVDDKEL